MASKKRLGDVGDIKLGKDVLSVVATKGRAVEAEPQAAAPARVVTTTLRLTEEHHKALRAYAFERAEARGGRFDVSAALRDILDEWLRRR